MATLETLIEHARNIRATDIHLIAGAQIAYRVGEDIVRDGKCLKEPLDSDRIWNLIEPIMTQEQKQMLKEHKQVVFAYGQPALGRFRLTVSQQRGSCTAALKLVSSGVAELGDLELPEVVLKLTSLREGLIVVAGGARSGKSTTAASILEHINRSSKRSIVTLENPIEYLFRHGESIIRQKEIGMDAHSYLNGLETTLREDPDVIFIDRVPDIPTLEMALGAAESGHLVILTLNAKDSCMVLEQMIESFPEDYKNRMRMQIAHSLKAVLVQQLLWTQEGAPALAMEVLLNHAGIRRLILENKLYQIPKAISGYSDMGMCTMEESLKALILKEKVTKEVALHHANNPQALLECLNVS